MSGINDSGAAVRIVFNLDAWEAFRPGVQLNADAGTPQKLTARPTRREARAQAQLMTAKARRRQTWGRVLSVLVPGMGLTVTALFVYALAVV